ncbi:MAG: hypothetical protein LBR39_06685 [Coriobacteriales bacterium]|jgi:hypothetical protein|nr:hypothetical protein [Coriobacteriales bacterium]
MAILGDGYSKAYLAALTLRDVRQKFNLSYPELVALDKEHHISQKVIENYGILHYYGSESIIATLKEELGVSFV